MTSRCAIYTGFSSIVEVTDMCVWDGSCSTQRNSDVLVVAVAYRVTYTSHVQLPKSTFLDNQSRFDIDYFVALAK